MWLYETLEERATADPSRAIFRFLNRDGEPESLSAGSLLDAARIIGGHLQHRVGTEQAIILLFEPGLDFLCALFGTLSAGCIAVPMAVPRNRGGSAAQRLHSVVQEGHVPLVLTTSEIATRLWHGDPSAAPHHITLQGILERGDDDARHFTPVTARAQQVVCLQYTSGSTSAPKGVMITHAGLLDNLGRIQERFRSTPSTRGVSWLPPYHDMGLVGCIFQPFYAGFTPLLMSPTSFVQRPARWLSAISTERAQLSGGPTFAYDLCARRIHDEQLVGIDLSTWELAFVGAERVDNDVLDAFGDRFSRCGFRRSALYPCYGLAEATLLVSAPQRGANAGLLTVSKPSLARGEVEIGPDPGRDYLENAHADQAGVTTLVGCGSCVDQHEVLVVDPETLVPCDSTQVGEIWVRGPSLAAGYHRRAAETQAVFQARTASGDGPYLRTGDLGFLFDAELFVCGRLSTQINVHGRKFAPEDLEASVQASHQAFVRGSGAAFNVVPAQSDQSPLVIVNEIARDYLHSHELPQAIRAAQRALGQEHGLAAHDIVMVKPGAVPRTTSGKIQRHACAELYATSALSPIASSRQRPISSGGTIP